MPASNALRGIPSVESLLQDSQLQDLVADVPRRLVLGAVRTAVEELRGLLLEEPGAVREADMRAWVLSRAVGQVDRAWKPHFRRAVNATGIILHTGLGRAVLPPRAIRQLKENLSGYSVLQIDPETGKRSARDARIEWLLCQLTGAEAATVVNNNAAATMIVLNTVGQGREIIVSRGQLVEIGGSFRLPEVMAASGARLVEVGATNKAHPRDYEAAVTENTAAILRVHPSNYKIVGFASEVPLPELVRIAHERGLVVIDDVGAGALLDYSEFGFAEEPALPDSIRMGADLVTASADKLIGASQAGIILGKADLVKRIRKNPLARVVRVDKLTLSVLETTLSLFFDEALAKREVPTLRMLVRDLSDIAAQAGRIACAVREAAPAATVDVIEGSSQMGSGSLPTQNIPTRLVAVSSEKLTADEIASRLRRYRVPVFARIQDERVLVDSRTLLDGDEEVVVAALAAALGPQE